jgi:hypothetical protein
MFKLLEAYSRRHPKKGLPFNFRSNFIPRVGDRVVNQVAWRISGDRSIPNLEQKLVSRAKKKGELTPGENPYDFVDAVVSPFFYRRWFDSHRNGYAIKNTRTPLPNFASMQHGPRVAYSGAAPILCKTCEWIRANTIPSSEPLRTSPG